MRDFFEQVRKSIEVELESISMDSCDISVDGRTVIERIIQASD